MKCCKCNKEIDIKDNSIPPKWFGMYIMSELIRVVCDECIKKDRDWEK